MTNTNTSLISPLFDWHLIRISGLDCKTFLQNLFTNNILHLSLHESQLSGFCSPKGRLLASFWITLSSTDTYELWISADLAEEFTKKLSMYRLRSKVSIQHLSSEMKVYGQISELPFSHEEELHCVLPNIQWQDKVFYRRLIASPEEIKPTNSTSFWNLLEVQSGIPRITEKTKDLFVPQMINFESVGAVDFKKGCYPGQEIVARSQYLGTIKRRLKIASLSFEGNKGLEIIPGMEVFSESDPDQACGIVVLSSIDIFKNCYYFQLEIKLSEMQETLFFMHKDLKYFGIVLSDPPYQLITI
jgi:hypothetical protein